MLRDSHILEALGGPAPLLLRGSSMNRSQQRSRSTVPGCALRSCRCADPPNAPEPPCQPEGTAECGVFAKRHVERAIQGGRQRVELIRAVHGCTARLSGANTPHPAKTYQRPCPPAGSARRGRRDQVVRISAPGCAVECDGVLWVYLEKHRHCAMICNI